VKPSRLLYHLKVIAYDPVLTAFLVDGFTNGFTIGHKGPVLITEPDNHASVSHNLDVTQSMLQQEIDAGRMAGPFRKQPFHNFRVSPLKLVPKPNSSKKRFRLIHNLSHPFKGDSINASIPQSAKKVCYSTILDAIRVILTLPKPVFTAKTDLENAFKIIPVAPSDYSKLGIKFKGQYYYDKTLPPGTASACQIFEKFSTALHAIHRFYARDNNSVHMLDDFLFLSHPASLCQSNMNLFDAICEDVGVPIALDKKTLPSQNTVFLGIELDTTADMAVLPPEKLCSYSESITQALSKKSLTRTQLESLVGKLSFASMVVPARPFLRRMIDLMSTIKIPHHHVRLTSEVRKDLTTWLHFMSNYNGRTYFRLLGVLDSPQLHLFSDASKLGFGATFGPRWIQAPFPLSWQNKLSNHEIHISFLELYPVMVCMEVFGKFITNTNVLFHSDNQTVVHVLNKQSSKDKLLMSLIRPLVLTLIKFNISLRLQHIPGLYNYLPDAISRFQVTPQILADNGMNPNPEQVPPTMLPANFRLRSKKMSGDQ
jgi:hypothetical protein